MEAFERILVNEDIELVVAMGTDYTVRVETGEYLQPDVEVKVVAGQLVLTMNNTCNFFRDYGLVRVYVTAPELSEIRSSTQFGVVSDGVLTYPALSLYSQSYLGPEYLVNGEFFLEVATQSLYVEGNGLANIAVSGTTDRLEVNYTAGNIRFYGADLLADEVEIFHRSSQDITVHPLNALRGELYGTGNLISVHRPPVVEVNTFYKGKLLFP